MGIPDGQLLASILCLINDNPRPNILFGAPALSLALLEHNLDLDFAQSSLDPSTVLRVIRPLCDTCFDIPRIPRHRVFRKGENDEHWIVFDAQAPSGPRMPLPLPKPDRSASAALQLDGINRDRAVGLPDLGEKNYILQSKANLASGATVGGRTRTDPRLSAMSSVPPDLAKDTTLSGASLPVSPRVKQTDKGVMVLPAPACHSSPVPQTSESSTRSQSPRLPPPPLRGERKELDFPSTAPLPLREPITLRLDPNLPGGAIDPVPKSATLKEDKFKNGLKRAFTFKNRKDKVEESAFSGISAPKPSEPVARTNSDAIKPEGADVSGKVKFDAGQEAIGPANLTNSVNEIPSEKRAAEIEGNTPISPVNEDIVADEDPILTPLSENLSSSISSTSSTDSLPADVLLDYASSSESDLGGEKVILPKMVELVMEERSLPPTPFLTKAFEDLPFGPDVPAFQIFDWIGGRWQVLLAEIVGVLGLAYVIQAAGL